MSKTAIVVPDPSIVGLAALNASKLVEAEAVAAAPNVRFTLPVLVGEKLHQQNYYQ